MSDNQHYQEEMLALSKSQSKKYWDNQKGEKIHIISDCDGIMTSANITYTDKGKRQKHFSVNDSLAVEFLQEHLGQWFDIVVLTGDKGPGLEVTKQRLEQINLSFVSCKNVNKYGYIKANYDISKVVYIGDDIFDYAIFKECAFGATVCNAPTIVTKYADYVSPFEGGKNAFTDILFAILEQYGIDVEAELDAYMLKAFHKTTLHKPI
jgi:3-deoxy-D-manno-octulosonate 8-phosphate phosphatase (KDO 8-P phosphatase)